MSVRQIAQTWGEDALPDEMKAHVTSDPYRRYPVLHFVNPNDDIQEAVVGAPGMPFSSTYWLMGGQTLLHEGGFEEMPYLCPRWSVTGEDTYGRGVDNMRLAAIVAQYWDEHQADACFIDYGGGVGVIDRLRQLGRNAIGVQFGAGAEATNNKKFANKRAEMWSSMRDWLRTLVVAIPNDPELKTELETPLFGHDRYDRLLIEKKEDIKKRIGSPDVADSVALTFAENVLPKRMRDGMPENHFRAKQKFNPLEVRA